MVLCGRFVPAQYHNFLSMHSSWIQSRLLLLAALFLGLFTLALNLAPSARARSWDVNYRWEVWLGFILWLAAFVVANRQTARYLPNRDPYLLPIAALLSGWGLLTVWRLLPSFGLRQSIWLLVVLGILILALRLPNNLAFLRQYKYLWLTGGLTLTALTLLLGTNPATGSGPRLWLGCCGVYFQPSEPLKLLLVVYLSAYLADRLPFSIGMLPLLAPTMIMTGLSLLLLVVQRDLGTATIFIFLFAVIVYFATGQARILAICAATLGLAGVAGYALFDVVRLRVDAWLNPWQDPSGGSYQIVQSLLAIANGGLLGRGPGLGNPSLVPVAHSDFIFAAIAEETGLLGVIGLVTLLALMAARGLHVTLQAQDRFRQYLAAGVTAYLVGQSVLIISGNLRLLPLTGVTLPFVSYGGSSLLSAFLALLLLLHISNSAKTMPAFLPDARPYLNFGGFIFISLAAISLATGWWGYYRGPDLLQRTDNPRRAIADRFVRRGAILDRRNTSLSATSGSPGELIRQSLYPPLGPIIGYTHPIYGQAGVEASLDDYLRGLRGNPSLLVWWHHLLYGQPPPGLDVRLSINLELQREADQLLGDRKGALVLLNAQSGEILAMASHPTFNPNQLEDTWADLTKNPDTPLFNRATLGRYQPGTALGPLFQAALGDQELPPLPKVGVYIVGGLTLDCAQIPAELTWESSLAAGCPSSQLTLGLKLGEDKLLQLYKDLGLYTPPPIHLPTNGQTAPKEFSDPQLAILGQSDVSVSPLQMALAMGTLSTGGIRPVPRLVMAVNTYQLDWVLLPPMGEPVQVFTPGSADAVANSLAVEGLPAWRAISSTPNGRQGYVTWYLGGTLPSWDGAPMTLVVLLEEKNLALAEVIGGRMIKEALQLR